MSSIYRKGRDGYFYYQTYVANPETGNKDKRIFHALGTKDRIEAEKKKRDFDEKYKNYKNISHQRIISKKLMNKFKIPFIIITTIIMTTTIKSSLDEVNKGKSFTQTQLYDQEKIINNPANSTLPNDKTKLKDLELDSIAETISESEDTSERINKISKFEQEESVLPDYEIIRIERFIDSFKLGKFHIAVDKNTSKKSQLALCQQLKIQFHELSNLVICLYSDNEAGRDLAMGNKKAISAEEQKINWLALYTYNPVEGEYFDDYPNGYLGIY